MESESISDWMFAPIIAKWTKGLSGLDRICCCVLFQTKQKLCGDSFSDVKTRRLGPSLRLHRCQVSTRRSSEMESNNATRFFLYFFFWPPWLAISFLEGLYCCSTMEKGCSIIANLKKKHTHGMTLAGDKATCGALLRS